jgi:hypothetical protein
VNSTGFLVADARRQSRMSKFQLTTRRILWAAGVGLAGFLIGGKGGGILGADLGLVWGASVGFGFGWIFDQKQPSKWAVVVWAVTWALIGTFFGLIAGAVPDYTLAKQIAAGISGAAVGALFGLVIGILRERNLRQRVTADL